MCIMISENKIKFLYCGNESFYIRNRVKRLLSDFYPQLDIEFIFINNFRIGSLFNIKDRMPVNVRSSVVYEYHCNFNVTYIGKTEHHLCVRRTGRHLNFSTI